MYSPGVAYPYWVNIASRHILHNHGNVATERSPKLGLCPTLIKRLQGFCIVHSIIDSTAHSRPLNRFILTMSVMSAMLCGYTFIPLTGSQWTTTMSFFNPFKPEFIIVNFLHYKPRIAVAILDLKWMKMTRSGWKIKENCHVLVNQFYDNFRSKALGCRKIKSVFRDVKWCSNASWGLKGLTMQTINCLVNQ